MTVIAYRGGVLAADSMVCDPSVGRRTGVTQKIGRHGPFRWAWSGDHGNARRTLDWIIGGQRGRQPRFKSGSVIIIPDEGEMTIYGQGTSWPVPDGPFHAWGSGSSYALGALAVGANPVEAVEAACLLMPGECGGPIRTVT